MANPKSPHIIGVTLDSQGVAGTKVVLTNLTSGGSQIVNSNANKQLIVDCSDFSNGYENGDVIGIENVGASYGGTTVTIDTAQGMQTTTLDCAAISSINISM